jgi:hypothetical protein
MVAPVHPMRERRGYERQAHIFFFAGVDYISRHGCPCPTIALRMISRRSVQEWNSCAASELKR